MLINKPQPGAPEVYLMCGQAHEHKRTCMCNAKSQFQALASSEGTRMKFGTHSHILQYFVPTCTLSFSLCNSYTKLKANKMYSEVLHDLAGNTYG